MPMTTSLALAAARGVWLDNLDDVGGPPATAVSRGLDDVGGPPTTAVSRGRALHQQWPRLESDSPLAPQEQRIGWLHIPKAGTSFGTALAHLANASLPAEAAMRNCALADVHCLFNIVEIDFVLRYPYDTFFQGIFWTKASTDFGNHDSLSPTSGWAPAFEKSIYTMVREPTSHKWSAYNHFGHHCHDNFTSFDAASQGTQVTMLTGQRSYGLNCLACGFRCEPVVPDVSLAIERMWSFAFVGLSDEWALSVCLLHAMHGATFGTPTCSAAEFANARKASYKNVDPTEYATRAEAADPHDRKLYEAARSRFERDLVAHDVNPETCQRRGCWDEGGA